MILKIGTQPDYVIFPTSVTQNFKERLSILYIFHSDHILFEQIEWGWNLEILKSLTHNCLGMWTHFY